MSARRKFISDTILSWSYLIVVFSSYLFQVLPWPDDLISLLLLSLFPEIRPFIFQEIRITHHERWTVIVMTKIVGYDENRNKDEKLLFIVPFFPESNRCFYWYKSNQEVFFTGGNWVCFQSLNGVVSMKWKGLFSGSETGCF